MGNPSAESQSVKTGHRELFVGSWSRLSIQPIFGQGDINGTLRILNIK